MAQTHAPAALEELAHRRAELDQEIRGLETEARLGADHEERLEQLRDARALTEERHGRLASMWQQERDTVGRIREIEQRLLAAGEVEASRLRHELGGVRLELEVLHDRERLVPLAVDGRAVAEVVSAWTGIPTGQMLAEGAAGARRLRDAMAGRIVGQEIALDTICRRIQTYFAELAEPGKPAGVFLLTGPSGVGKTETALALADLLFGGPAALITVNMSEYQEAHSVSQLKGAPPGYIGHGKGGVLTEAVRRRPYSVVLLDEIEKAHADVVELFYQVFDKGMLEDSDGQIVDFTNTVILLTSNIGSEILEAARGRAIDPEHLASALRPALLRHFPAAFLGRVVTVPFLALGDAELDAVVGLKLAHIQQRFESSHRAALSWDPSLVRAVRARAVETESGARAVDAILTQSLLPGLAGRMLDRIAEGQAFTAAHVGVGQGGELVFEFRP
jgi:type VI secretion system protein VasG